MANESTLFVVLLLNLHIMATISYKLSTKKNVDGKQEVIARLTITPKLRPSFKTDVWVNSKYFRAVRQTGHGSVWEIVPPKQSGFNVKDVKEATASKNELTTFTCRLLKLCQLAESFDKDLLTKEWLQENMILSLNVKVEDLSIQLLQNLKVKLEEQTNKPAVKSIYDLGNLYLKENNFSYDHSKAFRVLLRDLRRFELYIQKKKNPLFELNVDTLTMDDVKDFFYYLSHEYEFSKMEPELFRILLEESPKVVTTKHTTNVLKERGDNTLYKLKKRLRIFFNWLNKQQITSNNPVKLIEIGTEKYGEPIYITEEERNIIANFDFSDKKDIETQRDIFIFQCLVGCRVGDLIKLTRKNIVDDVLSYVPGKTKDNDRSHAARVPLSQTAMNIVDKYKHKTENDMLFPFISTQKYNENIKKIFTLCGITRFVNVRNPITGNYERKRINTIASSHMARRTFIGAAYNVVKDPNIVCKMSGHAEGSKAFYRYRNISDDILWDVINKIDVKSKKDVLV